MPDEPNGLASMTKARERRARRTMPPPRHPTPASAAEPMSVEAAAESVEEELDQPALTTNQGSDASRAPVENPTLVQEEPTAAGESARPARPATVYLDEAHVDFLDQARIAGLMSRPRLDISKSAVMRLALRRLQEEMTVEEIRDYLKAQPIDSTKTGRKRR